MAKAPKRRARRAAAGRASARKVATGKAPAPPRNPPPKPAVAKLVLSSWSKPEQNKDDLLSANFLPANTKRLAKLIAPLSDPLEIRSKLLAAGVPTQKTRRDLTRVRAALASAGGTAMINALPMLPGAILFEVYSDSDSDIDPETVGRFSEEKYAEIGSELFKDQIRRVLYAVDPDDRVSEQDVQSIYDDFALRRVPFAEADSPGMTEEVLSALAAVRHDQPILSSLLNGDGTFKVEADLKKKLTPGRRRRIVQTLSELGIDPGKLSDREELDWARIGLGLSSAQGATADLVGLSFDPDETDLDRFERMELPEFEDESSRGLQKRAIKTAADLYYFSRFRNAGFYQVPGAMLRELYDRRWRVSDGLALRLYSHVVTRKSLRIPDVDRVRFMNQVFGREFKERVGRFVEHFANWSRTRNAAEYISQDPAATRPPVQSRSAVMRSLMSLMRYLSDAGLGLARMISLEEHAEFSEIYKILSTKELQARFADTDETSVISAMKAFLARGDDAGPRDIDRDVTLAVYGRRMMRWMADNASNVSSLSDIQLDELAEHANFWLAGFRKEEEPPAWIEEDETDEEDEEEDIGDVAAREAVAAANEEARPEMLD